MGRVIVIEFVSLDGVVSDPDGSAGTPGGGWAFRHGPETVAGDKFRLGRVMDEGVMLLGRTSWQLFSRLWPNRTDEYRLLTFPSIIGTGTKLFPDLESPVHLRLASVDQAGAATLATYQRSESGS